MKEQVKEILNWLIIVTISCCGVGVIMNPYLIKIKNEICGIIVSLVSLMCMWYSVGILVDKIHETVENNIIYYIYLIILILFIFIIIINLKPRKRKFEV